MTTSYQAFAKLYIGTGEGHADGAFGNGLVSLLRGIRDSGSLNKSAKDMHMAYSKAWKLMNSAEEQLGVQLISRDGARGSTLTPEGARLVEAFDTVSRDVDEYARKRLQEELARS